MSIPTFPEGFWFGAATASYQLEGAVTADGRGPSIWDTFSHTPGATLDGDTGDVACDHYHRMSDDVALMAELGIDAYRFSIAWPRIQPDGRGPANSAGVDFYSRLVDALLDAGIKPAVTLYHWDLPQALEDAGGWPVRDTALRFADYAQIMAEALGDRVALWMTHNEPWCAAFVGYASGHHAPGRQEPAAALAAAHHLNLSHGLAAQAVRAAVPSARVGIALNVHALTPASDDPADVAAWRRLEAVGNDIFLTPVLEGRYTDETLAATDSICDWRFVRPGDLETARQPLDALGVNFYSTWKVAQGDPGEDGPWVGSAGARQLPPTGPLTQMDWNIDPAGFTDLLVRLHERYPAVPLMITENGAAFPDSVAADGAVHDADRIAYLDAHLRAVRDAMDRGVDVRAYFLWSLMDNFEWGFGYSKRFGLFRVDYDTLERTWKDSARWYQAFLADRWAELARR